MVRETKSSAGTSLDLTLRQLNFHFLQTVEGIDLSKNTSTYEMQRLLCWAFLES